MILYYFGIFKILNPKSTKKRKNKNQGPKLNLLQKETLLSISLKKKTKTLNFLIKFTINSPIDAIMKVMKETLFNVSIKNRIKNGNFHNEPLLLFN